MLDVWRRGSGVGPSSEGLDELGDSNAYIPDDAEISVACVPS